jgi:uncharacterized phiE125 gp8 family phage protein
MSRLVLINPASERLLTLEQAKSHCKCQHDAENELFLDWIKSAEAYCQKYADRVLLTSTWRWISSQFPCTGKAIDLKIAPVQSISSVSYTNTAGTLVSLPAQDYQLEPDEFAPMLWEGVDASWPATQQGNVSAVTVELVAGFSSRDLVPLQFKQAMYLIIGDWYVHRDMTRIHQEANHLLDQVAIERYV